MGSCLLRSESWGTARREQRDPQVKGSISYFLAGGLTTGICPDWQFAPGSDEMSFSSIQEGQTLPFCAYVEIPD